MDALNPMTGIDCLMAAVGRVLLVLGFAFCALYGLGASLYGGWRHDEAWIHSGRRAMYSLALIADRSPS